MQTATHVLPPPAFSSPLRRPRVARAVTLGLVVLLLLAVLVISGVVAGLGSAAAVVFLKALAISSALSVIPVAILWYLDRRERESAWLYAAAFFWGGLIATSLALPINTAAIFAVGAWLEQNVALRDMLGPEGALMIGAPLAAPLVEEAVKGLGIVLLFWLARAEFDNVRDGFIYGALVGAGFNWFESALYVQQNFAQFGTAPYGFQLGVRYAWLGLAGHAMFSGIFGAALGLARSGRRHWWRWLIPVAGFVVAAAAHAWNNVLPLVATVVSVREGAAPPTAPTAPPELGLVEAMASASISNLVIFLPFVLLLAWIVSRSGRWEREVIRDELADEVGRSVTAAELEAAARDSRLRSRRAVAKDPRIAAAIVNAQNELAFRKRRLKDRGHDPAADPLVAARRLEIEELRRRDA
ncbi:MAG: protease PrsW [Lysobacterales bacterium]|jgi:RsiW-degrading membrane proteinase PrsW (M82 family)|nr:MAG: protease PrsW [Xanthomonadales bacterium]